MKNMIKKIVVTSLVLILIFSITGCGNEKEKADEGGKEKVDEGVEKKADEEVEEKNSAEEKTDVKLFRAEDLVTMEEVSTITGVPIVDIKFWDNDYMGLLGATYLIKKDGYDGFTLNCFQQPYCGAAKDNVEHPVIGPSVKQEYEKHKSIVKDNGDLEVVEDLGQDAYYDKVRNVLYVLYNDDYYFEVRDNYFDDPVMHKETAIKITKKALESLSEKL